ncbi:hypothetical protein AUF12_19440 [Enterococcus avium]|nr:hypothetical protein AUF12_19440 [Enterococcus avium]
MIVEPPISITKRFILICSFKKSMSSLLILQTVDKVYFMDDVYSLFFYNRFMKTNARSDSYDV